MPSSAHGHEHTANVARMAADECRTASQEDLVERVARYMDEMEARTAEFATALSPGTALAVSFGASPEIPEIMQARAVFSARSRALGSAKTSGGGREVDGEDPAAKNSAASSAKIQGSNPCSSTASGGRSGDRRNESRTVVQNPASPHSATASNRQSNGHNEGTRSGGRGSDGAARCGDGSDDDLGSIADYENKNDGFEGNHQSRAPRPFNRQSIVTESETLVAAAAREMAVHDGQSFSRTATIVKKPRQGYKERIKNVKAKVPLQHHRSKLELSDLDRRDEKLKLQRSEAIVHYLEVRRREFHEEIRQDIIERAERSRMKRQRLDEAHTRYLRMNESELKKPNGPKRPPFFLHHEQIPEHYKNKLYKQISHEMHNTPPTPDSMTPPLRNCDSDISFRKFENDVVNMASSTSALVPELSSHPPSASTAKSSSDGQRHHEKAEDNIAGTSGDHLTVKSVSSAGKARSRSTSAANEHRRHEEMAVNSKHLEAAVNVGTESLQKPAIKVPGPVPPSVAPVPPVAKVPASAIPPREPHGSRGWSRLMRGRSSVAKALPPMISLDRQIGLSDESLELWEADGTVQRTDPNKSNRRMKFNAMADNAFRFKSAANKLVKRFNDIPFRDFMDGMPVNAEIELAIVDDINFMDTDGTVTAVPNSAGKSRSDVNGGNEPFGIEASAAATASVPPATDTDRSRSSRSAGTTVTTISESSSVRFGVRTSSGKKQEVVLPTPDLTSLNERILSSSRRPGLLQTQREDELLLKQQQQQQQQQQVSSAGTNSQRSQSITSPATTITQPKSDRGLTSGGGIGEDPIRPTSRAASVIHTPHPTSATSATNTNTNSTPPTKPSSAAIAQSNPTSRPRTANRVNFSTQDPSSATTSRSQRSQNSDERRERTPSLEIQDTPIPNPTENDEHEPLNTDNDDGNDAASERERFTRSFASSSHLRGGFLERTASFAEAGTNTTMAFKVAARKVPLRIDDESTEGVRILYPKRVERTKWISTISSR